MPAAIVIVKFVTATKSVVSVAVPAFTETATAVTSVRADSFSSAVTVTIVAPAPSGTLAGETLSVTAVEPTSSSVIVRVFESGPVTLSVFVAVPETVTVLFAASTLLSTAVIVIVSVLVISPAAIVRVVPLSEKSAGTAGLTAAAETCMVVGAVNDVSSVAVTVLVPPLSDIEAGVSTSVTTGITGTGTAAVGALVTLSLWPSPSVKLTRTRSCLPSSATVTM